MRHPGLSGAGNGSIQQPNSSLLYEFSPCHVRIKFMVSGFLLRRVPP
jgi:hypothetical protein